MSISLVVTGDHLDVDFPTRRLRAIPVLAARRGEDAEAIAQGFTEPMPRWEYQLICPPDCTLNAAVDLLLEPLPDDPEVWDDLASQGTLVVECALLLPSQTSDCLLSLETMARLAARQLNLILHLVDRAAFPAS